MELLGKVLEGGVEQGPALSREAVGSPPWGYSEASNTVLCSGMTLPKQGGGSSDPLWVHSTMEAEQ